MVLGLLAVVCPLLGLYFGPQPGLLGWSGVARGEFENWAWSDWWLPHHLHCFPGWREQLWALVAFPRDFDFGNYLDGWLLTQPLKLVGGPVAGHNARVAVVLLLNAAAAWAACRQALRLLDRDDLLTAAIGAVALACNPITLWDIGESRFGQALIAPWLGYIAALLGWMASPTLRSTLWCAVWLALTALVYWFAALFVLPFAVVAVIARPGHWRAWSAQIAVAGLICLPFALPFVMSDRPTTAWGTAFPNLDTLNVRGPEVLGPPGPALTVAHSVDLARPLAPPLGPPLPWLWLLIAAGGIRLWPRKVAVGLALTALGGWLFALGPFWRFDGSRVLDGVPFQVAYRFAPMIWRLYWPARLLPFVLAALVLLGLPAVRLAVGRIGRASPLLAALALLPPVLAGVCPLPVSPLTVPAAYREGALGDVREGIFEASLEFNSGRENWYQTWHGHPVLGNLGYCPPRLSDWPPRWTRDPAELEQNGFVQWVEITRAGQAATWSDEGLRVMREAGFRWVVVQKRYGGQAVNGADALVTGLRARLGRPAVEDEDMVAWHLD